MKNTKFYFNRAWLVLAALLVSAFAAFSLPGCKTDDDDDEKEIHYSIYPVRLSADDPVSGVYSTKSYSDYGTEVAFILRPSIAYAIASSCAGLDSVEGLEKGIDYIDNPNTYDKTKYLDLHNSNPIYVVYNLFSDADSSDGISDDELDKHSGVILFQAKYSMDGGCPNVGCWYGVKFQFLTEDGKIPTSTNKNSIFSSTKIYIEGAAGEAYNNIAALDEAVEKFAFNNSDCFNETSWTASSSGADKTGRSAFSSIVPTENIFTKVE